MFRSNHIPHVTRGRIFPSRCITFPSPSSSPASPAVRGYLASPSPISTRRRVAPQCHSRMIVCTPQRCRPAHRSRSPPVTGHAGSGWISHPNLRRIAAALMSSISSRYANRSIVVFTCQWRCRGFRRSLNTSRIQLSVESSSHLLSFLTSTN